LVLVQVLVLDVVVDVDVDVDVDGCPCAPRGVPDRAAASARNDEEAAAGA
jgi:coenzyme F420-reducing hydrogenase gamma subunit